MKLKDVVFEVRAWRSYRGKYNWIADTDGTPWVHIVDDSDNDTFDTKAEAIENAKSFFTENDLKFKILGE